METLKYARINYCSSTLKRSDSGEEDCIKAIDMKSDCPIQTARHTIKHYDFNPSNARMISWAKVRIKNIKRTTRRVNKSTVQD